MRAHFFPRYPLVTLALGVAGICLHAPFAERERSSSPAPLDAGKTLSTRPGIDTGYAVPMGFEPNRGQSDSQVRFLSRGPGYTLFLTANEAVLSLRRPEQPLVLRMRPEGANPAPRVTGESRLSGEVNYVKGRTPQDSLTGIPSYGRVRYEDVYPGIDLLYYGNGHELEYDFIIAAGANPDRIRLDFSGVEKLSVNDKGELVLHTAAGDYPQPRPVIYQEVDGVRREIHGGYLLLGERQIGFEVAAYDRSHPLVIDPVLAYSTYFGGATEEIGWDIAVDSAGNAYITGARPSVAAPESMDSDAFVAKFGPGGALVWVTDVGDVCDDEGRGIAVDAAGNAYITGQIGGNCYPFPQLVAGAFVAKLTASGAASYVFAFSNPFGGSADVGQAVAVDAAGRAYVGGVSTSEGFPTTPGAFQPQHAGGIGDGFIVKVNAAGTALLYATYLGGNGHESLNDIALDGSGNAYVTGSTASKDFPTRNAFQGTHPGWGAADASAFVSKLNGEGSDVVYSTYLGGGPNDFGLGIAVDPLGHAYVTGITQSVEFPITEGVVQPLPGDDRNCMFGWCTDAFVTKFSPSGSALIYSTYLGGNVYDEGVGIAIDAAGNAYITGNTRSTNFPTVDAFQPAAPGDEDAFVAKLNATATALIYSSYLGGSKVNDVLAEGEDAGIKIAVDSNGGSAYVVGVTRSPDFPVTNAHQPVFGGGLCGVVYRCADAFVAKIGWGCTFSINPASQAVAAGGGVGSITVGASSSTCAWTATSAVSWITITSGGAGTGNGTVGFAVAPNTTGASRTGTLSVAGLTFTVSQAAAALGSVTVTFPNTAVNLAIGSTQRITWTHTLGAQSFVKIELSRDGGLTFPETLVAAQANDSASAGSYHWLVTGPATGAKARIRVTALNGSASDTGNVNFKIAPPFLKVTAPRAGQLWPIGSSRTISWKSNLGALENVQITLSKDGGLTYPILLAASTPSDGKHTVVVDPAWGSQTTTRVKIAWTKSPGVATVSASFIVQP